MIYSDASYEVWALGYDSDGDRMDAEILVETFRNPAAAIQYAQKITWEKIQKIDEDNVFDFSAYISIEVETVVDDGNYGTTNIDSIYSKAIAVRDEVYC